MGSGRGNYPTGKNGNGTSGAKDDGYRKVSGRTTKINADKQKKHIPGARNYLPGRSIFSGSVEHAQQLLSEFAGTGERISSDRERVNFGQTIGTYRSGPNDPGIKTTIGIIMYSKTGAHIVPARPKER